jgi:2-polyprenyl-3-methyl-5-hydroxy-6-metoxy-1,4-benzoquinol methylase
MDEIEIDGRATVIIPCSYCQTVETDTLFIHHQFAYQRCQQCELVRVNPQLTQEAIGKIYQDGYKNKSETISTHAKHLQIPSEHQEILKTLAQICGSTGRLLDIGCFEGHFLWAARESGWQVTGTEISETAVTFARETWQLDVRLGALEKVHFADNQFDAVVLGDVIEHLPDPRRTFEEINRILRPGGAVYVWTPNFNSITRQLFKQKWGAVIFPWHLYYFTPKTLIQLCASAGISCHTVTTYNWLLDFRDPYLSIQSQKPPQQRPLWLQRGLRLFDKVTAPILKQASKYNLFWGTQIAFYGKKDA